MNTRQSQPRSALDPNFPRGYLPRQRLGAGSEGEVWVFDDIYLARKMMGKRLQLGNFHADIENLQSTMALAAAVHHPNVNEATNVIPDDRGTFWLMSHYTEGVDLDYLLSQRMLSDLAILQILVDVSRGLDAIATANVVHGDLSPKNIIVGPQGTSKITDFGLACRVGDQTNGGGTPGYIAPEKSRKGEAQSALDVFSFGALISRVLTGKTPIFINDGSGNALLSSIKIPGESSRLRQDLAELASTALDADPDRRPGTALLLHTLEQMAAEGSPEGLEQLAQDVTQLMAERAAEAVLDPLQTRPVSLWRRWGTLMVPILLVTIAGLSALYFYLRPNLPNIEPVTVSIDLSVAVPKEFTPVWLSEQVELAVAAQWANWNMFSEESLQLSVDCSERVCEVLLLHSVDNGVHTHVRQLSSSLASRSDVWRGALRDIVNLAASS